MNGIDIYDPADLPKDKILYGDGYPRPWLAKTLVRM